MNKEHGVPIFVKIDEYKDIINITEIIRNKLEQAKRTLQRINELKKQEDSEMALWESNIDEIEKRMEQIDNSLFEFEK